MRPAKVAIFDSGIGGLSIAVLIRKLIPNTELHYLCDNKNFPYGSKTDSEVEDSTLSALANLIAQRMEPDVIILACNTASTVALELVRSELKIPVIGVVPAIKPAARFTKSGKIGLLATPMTIRRPYTDQLISDNAAGIEVLRIGSSRLVDLAEKKLRDGQVDPELISRELGLFREAVIQPKPLDTIVLGCTHFPWLHRELVEALPVPVTFVDSGMAITRRCRHVLHSKGLIADPLARQDAAEFQEDAVMEPDDVQLEEQRLIGEQILSETLNGGTGVAGTERSNHFYVTEEHEVSGPFQTLIESLRFQNPEVL